MITVQQIRAARAALKWSIEELSMKSDVSVRTIKTIEGADGTPSCRLATLKKLTASIEAAGIEFIGSPDDRPGIRIGPPKA
jgi:ribosome-binding protein aMBF1 (putative translation factor)